MRNRITHRYRRAGHLGPALLGRSNYDFAADVYRGANRHGEQHRGNAIVATTAEPFGTVLICPGYWTRIGHAAALTALPPLRY
jgi:hypothetical protein